LLADVAAGRLDIIVIYKVDRLNRSLIDFSKPVRKFDASNTSFVSITHTPRLHRVMMARLLSAR